MQKVISQKVTDTNFKMVAIIEFSLMDTSSNLCLYYL